MSLIQNDDKNQILNTHVLQKIQNQIEFYLSDANILKDKFIQNLLRENEETLNERKFIELKNFLNFKKIKLLTNNIENLKKSLKKSNQLELSQDELFVRRKNLINYDKNIDACTVYLEKLSDKIDHDWINNVFSIFGSIDHISIPKFKKTKISMGFAFVEFSKPEEAFEVCNFFNSDYFESQKNNLSSTENNVIKSILSYDLIDEKNNDFDISEKELKEKMNEVINEVIKKEMSLINLKKRSVENNEFSHIKKQRIELKNENDLKNLSLDTNSLTANNNCDEISMNKVTKNDLSSNEQLKFENYLNQIKSKVNEEYKTLFFFRVLSKEKWLSYKKDFMKIKRKLKKENKVTQKDVSENCKNSKNYEKNLIIKIVYTKNEITNIDSLFKKFLRSLNYNQSIAYIDINQSETICYIRFKDSNAAINYSKDPKLKEIGTVSFLDNKDEENYWIDIYKNINEKKLHKTKKFKVLKKNFKSLDILKNGSVIKLDVNIDLDNEESNSKLKEKIKNCDKENILFVEIDESKNLFLNSNLLRKSLYVRCKNQESVKNIIDLGKLDKIGSVSLLNSEEELDYWQKTKQKLNSKK